MQLITVGFRLDELAVATMKGWVFTNDQFTCDADYYLVRFRESWKCRNWSWTEEKENKEGLKESGSKKNFWVMVKQWQGSVLLSYNFWSYLHLFGSILQWLVMLMETSFQKKVPKNNNNFQKKIIMNQNESQQSLL